MADYHIQFSFTVQTHGADQEAWIHQLLKSSDNNEAAVTDARLIKNQIAFLKEAGVEDPYDDDYSTWPSLEYDFQNEGIWWIHDYAGESNPDCAAQAVKAYLKKFQPNGFVVFEIAYTCSSPRLDAFGGAGYAVTADDIKVEGSQAWIHEQCNELAMGGGEHVNGPG